MIIFVPNLLVSKTLTLSIEQIRHLKAKRIAHSSICITLSDGQYSAQATLSEGKKSILATYEHCTLLPVRTMQLTLYFSIIKPDRMSWLIEKAVEIGIDRLVPLHCERTQGMYWSPSTYEHLRKVMLSACTQSLQCTPPLLDIPQSLEQAVMALHTTEHACFYGDLNPQSLAPHQVKIGKECPAHLFIGPEGGWSSSEQTLLKQQATPIFYPGPVLRTETAALVLGSLLQGIRLS